MNWLNLISESLLFHTLLKGKYEQNILERNFNYRFWELHNMVQSDLEKEEYDTVNKH